MMTSALRERLRILILSLAIPCLAPPAYASDSDWGYISTIEAFSTGVILVTTTGSRSTAPACQSTRPDLAGRWALDANSTSGQALLSILSTSYALKKRIRIVGAGACGAWFDSETINYIQVEPS